MIVEINQKMLSIFETNFSTNTTDKNLMTNADANYFEPLFSRGIIFAYYITVYLYII